MQRRFRLRRNEDFQRVRYTGQSWAHPLLVLAVAVNDKPHNRYGIITTRRLGNAVTRNRARRRIRAVLHKWHPRIAPGYDMIWIVRSPAPHCSSEALEKAVGLLLHRANLL